MAHKGYFVIADITGYTAFLTGSELDHAQDILKSLFNTLLDHITPPLIISNFQGDAVLTYAPEGSFVQGQTLLEVIENLYIAFAQAREVMRLNTTCTCRACANMPKLDLKVFIHYGEYIIQDMRGKAELSGPDVIIAHRMMKNDVKEKTGRFAYALFTEAAINGLGLDDFACELILHSERYEHIGEVKMFVYCLKTMWEREREKRRVFITPQEAAFSIEVDLPAPPSVVWDYLTEPELKRRTMEVEGITLSNRQRGRIEAGVTYHCAHGTAATADFMIMDWKPFEYITQDAVAGFPMKMQGRYTTRLTPVENGTRVAFCFTRLIQPMIQKEFKNNFTEIGVLMRRAIEEDLASGRLVLEAAAPVAHASHVAAPQGA